jgi:hypothetical protein
MKTGKRASQKLHSEWAIRVGPESDQSLQQAHENFAGTSCPEQLTHIAINVVNTSTISH